jgi:hypothetical protein
MKLFWKVLSVVFMIFALVSVNAGEAEAQCAMCRATLENNVSNGDIGIAAGINVGILYLFAMPYLLIAFIAFMWYRKSKENEQIRSYTPR